MQRSPEDGDDHRQRDGRRADAGEGRAPAASDADRDDYRQRLDHLDRARHERCQKQERAFIGPAYPAARSPRGRRQRRPRRRRTRCEPTYVGARAYPTARGRLLAVKAESRRAGHGEVESSASSGPLLSHRSGTPLTKLTTKTLTKRVVRSETACSSHGASRTRTGDLLGAIGPGVGSTGRASACSGNAG